MPSSNRRAKTALVIGATSSLAQSLCRKLAEQGYQLILTGRDERELEIRTGDITTRYPTHCTALHVDLLEKRFSATSLIERAGHFDTLIFAAGDMGSGEQDDLANLAHVAMINYVVASQILSVAAEAMSEAGGGNIAVISSVAGDRGRASNYEYGAAKAALSAFASGLRNRYAKRGVHVMTVKPGFTDTPMTWGMHSPLIATRDVVAEALIEGLERQKDVLYVPWFWRYIMLVIRHIPERVFKKLSL
ncbi:MAG: SDR family NAD(P)-dependent oxidoreductase [Alphaproteobacteria bacterium]|nr:SDR family NAD(P)-dependent oxidoreductase [Alphaproteobacteria bacterium]